MAVSTDGIDIVIGDDAIDAAAAILLLVLLLVLLDDHPCVELIMDEEDASKNRTIAVVRDAGETTWCCRWCSMLVLLVLFLLLLLFFVFTFAVLLFMSTREGWAVNNTKQCH